MFDSVPLHDGGRLLTRRYQRGERTRQQQVSGAERVAAESVPGILVNEGRGAWWVGRREDNLSAYP